MPNSPPAEDDPIGEHAPSEACREHRRRPDAHPWESLFPLRGRWLRYGLGAVLIVCGLIAGFPSISTNPPSPDPYLYQHLVGPISILAGIAIVVDGYLTPKRR